MDNINDFIEGDLKKFHKFYDERRAIYRKTKIMPDEGIVEISIMEILDAINLKIVILIVDSLVSIDIIKKMCIKYRKGLGERIPIVLKRVPTTIYTTKQMTSSKEMFLEFNKDLEFLSKHQIVGHIDSACFANYLIEPFTYLSGSMIDTKPKMGLSDKDTLIYKSLYCARMGVPDTKTVMY